MAIFVYLRKKGLYPMITANLLWRVYPNVKKWICTKMSSMSLITCTEIHKRAKYR